MDRRSRMRLARRVTEYLLSHHTDIVAVSLGGSTAKGEDREHSDMEMIAVTSGEPDTQHYWLIHEGIVIWVAFLSREEAEKKVARQGWNWPLTADEYVNGQPMHDPEGLLPRLATSAASPSRAEVVRGMRGAFIALYEDLCKMRNFAISGEEGMVRFFAPYVGVDAARFLGLLNGRHFNGLRNLLTKPRDFETLPPHFWDDFPVLLTVDAPASSLLEKAERLHEEVRQLWLSTGPRTEEMDLEKALSRGRTRT